MDAAYAVEAGLDIRQLQQVSLLRLHGWRAHTRLPMALRPVQIELPQGVNESAGAEPAAWCIAPGDWYLFAEHVPVQHLRDCIEPVLDAGSDVLINLSPAIAVLRVSGPASPWLLAKWCGLDLLNPGRSGRFVARTRLQDVGVTLHHVPAGGLVAGTVFDLVLDRSHVRHVWELLTSSMRHAALLQQRFGPRP